MTKFLIPHSFIHSIFDTRAFLVSFFNKHLQKKSSAISSPLLISTLQQGDFFVPFISLLEEKNKNTFLRNIEAFSTFKEQDRKFNTLVIKHYSLDVTYKCSSLSQIKQIFSINYWWHWQVI